MKYNPIHITTISYMLILLLLITSCTQNTQQEQAAPIPSFPMQTVVTQNTEQYFEYPATVRGQQNIEIRPKIDGYIAHIGVDEGATVRKGQLLFRINNPQYEQEVLTARAAIKRAEAAVNTARMNVKRTQPLVEKGIISEYELEAKDLELQSRLAELQEASARLRNAQVNVGYTAIHSPADGVIGTLPFKIGSLVSSMAEVPLTTLADIANVHVYFSFPEKQLLELIDAANKHQSIDEALKNIPPVQLVLADGTTYAEAGKIETTGGAINTGTGSIGLRARFANKEGILRSGGSATIRITRPLENVLVVPAKSTYELQGKKFVVTVGKDGIAKSAPIEVAPIPVGDGFLVTSGLETGTRIVTDQVGAIKDGDKINPKNEKLGAGNAVPTKSLN